MILLFILFNLFVYCETAPLGPTQCIYEGHFYQKGEWIKNSCNLCSCEGFNKFDCTQNDCNDKTLCVFYGKTYKVKKFFRHDCRDCLCLSQEVIMCYKQDCNSGDGYGIKIPFRG